jgi:hypothetical protein
MLHAIITAFARPGGPYLYLRLVTAGSAVGAIARLIPFRRKQVPGYRCRVPGALWLPPNARHRVRPGQRSSPLPQLDNSPSHVRDPSARTSRRSASGTSGPFRLEAAGGTGRLQNAHGQTTGQLHCKDNPARATLRTPGPGRAQPIRLSKRCRAYAKGAKTTSQTPAAIRARLDMAGRDREASAFTGWTTSTALTTTRAPSRSDANAVSALDGGRLTTGARKDGPALWLARRTGGLPRQQMGRARSRPKCG